VKAWRAILLLVGGLAPALTAQDRSPGEERFRERREYFLADGGRWLTVNPDHRPEDAASPSHFGYEFTPGPGPSAFGLRITGLVGQKTIVYWAGVYYWHPGRHRAEYHSVSSWGAVASGRAVGPDALWFEVVGPDGSVSRHLDRETFVSDEEFRSDSYVERGGRWIPSQTLTWKRGAA
jgi:hypothetical protein